MKIIENKSYDYERALYESKNLILKSCRFEGIADGESALKESADIRTENCFFDLRYPFWHGNGIDIINCEMTDKCRAPIWYSKSINLTNTLINGVKGLRECNNIKIHSCEINSSEFGWDSSDITVENSKLCGEYFLMRGKNLTVKNSTLNGKYSFQYIENCTFENCDFNTKDAFWHGKNVTVRNSTVKGEYLGWYCENVTFENCVIIGTQPLCYCSGLTLINCEMHECDLSFEKSCVNAEITTPVLSIKNVLSGEITVPSVGEIIKDSDKYEGIIKIKDGCLN